MRLPTIRDVAKRAGVGIGTVSRVLNKSPQVREETRQKVLKAIKELGFSPNIAARQLSGGKTLTIGVVTAFFTFPSFVERLMGIQDVLDNTDYDLALYSIRSTDQLHHRLLNLATQNRVDGLIVLSLPFSEHEIRQANPEFPIVVIDNATTSFPHIAIDNFHGGQLATEYLIAHGHRKIGFLGDELDSPLGFTSTPRRLDGHQQALTEAGLAYNADWTAFASYTERAAYEKSQQILNLDDRPTAIFAATDTLAFGALTAAHELGLTIPGDIAVIGFDDIQAASYMRLTTIRQHLVTSGQLGARLMLQWLDDGHIDQSASQIQLELEVIERTTV